MAEPYCEYSLIHVTINHMAGIGQNIQHLSRYLGVHCSIKTEPYYEYSPMHVTINHMTESGQSRPEGTTFDWLDIQKYRA